MAIIAIGYTDEGCRRRIATPSCRMSRGETSQERHIASRDLTGGVSTVFQTPVAATETAAQTRDQRWLASVSTASGLHDDDACTLHRRAPLARTCQPIWNTVCRETFPSWPAWPIVISGIFCSNSLVRFVVNLLQAYNLQVTIYYKSKRRSLGIFILDSGQLMFWTQHR